jgi:hypothetical protein
MDAVGGKERNDEIPKTLMLGNEREGSPTPQMFQETTQIIPFETGS